MSFRGRNTIKSNGLEGKHRILLIDSDAGQYHKGLVSSLRECSVIVETYQDKICESFLRNDIDLVLLDHFGDSSCTELLQFFRYVKPAVPVIIVTRCGSEELAVTVFRLGVKDYFKKPLVMCELKKSIRAALGINHVTEELPQSPWSSIHRAIRYINKNYTSRIKLSEIAKEAGKSISCFERTFKKETGITFIMYVNRLRISKAIKMLREDGLSMSDIAFACGFTNQFHFTRTFKRIMKTSPRVYKKSLRKKKSPFSHFKHLCKEKPKGYSLN
ncbi:MAG: helix-turn-helix domain-containing protein [Nitrospirota bacterium]|nr:helix-turn-helix domain-containing protein [Nitrospirota bacterium]